MAHRPFVSVIIPTYNRASLIGAAIQSVLDQTFKSVEIIVVDDGSTDDTQRALQPYASKIVSLVTANKGPAQARNVGMKAATGKYIAFLDSDDLYLPHKLELEVEFMERNPDIGMVSTNMSAMRGDEIVEEYHLQTYHGPFFREYGFTLEGIYPERGVFEFHGKSIPSYAGNIFKYMLHWPALISNTVLFPRDLLDAVGYQNEAYGVGEDYDHMVRICKHVPVACLDIPTYVYRYNEDQVTMLGSSWSAKREAARIRILETFVQIALDHREADRGSHSPNKGWLDPLLSRKYLELGRKLIGHGESRRARECFAKAHDYDPTDEAFFSKLLGDVGEPTAPYGIAAVQGDGSGIDEAQGEIDSALGRRLRDRARGLGVSVASVCHLAWAQVLARLSQRDDVLFGTAPVGHVRGSESTDRTPGRSTAALAVRIRIGEQSVQDGARNMHEVLSQLPRYEHAPLALVQRCSAMPATAPLFSALLIYRHGKPAAERDRARYPFVLSIDDLDDGFALVAHAQSPADPQRILAYMRSALEKLVAALERAPATSLCGLDVVPEVERQQVLVEWNATARDYWGGARLHRLIERQVAQTPDSPALVFDGRELTYSEMNRRANQLARMLRRRGVGPDVLVGVFAERSFEMVVALLAVLKAGGAYVPLDPSYPAERLGHMLEDGRAPVVLAQPHLAPLLPAQAGEVLILDSSWAAYAGERADDLEDIGTPQNLAYVIFTSGSTGRPKGAMNEHRGICNRLLWMQEEYGLTGEDRVLQKTPFSFDVSVWEFFWPLLTGARLVIARPESHKDSAYLVKLIRDSGITTLHFVPSMLRVFVEEEGLEACGSLRRVICSGEALPHELQERFFARLPRAELHNLYGPTEAAVDVTYWACRRGDRRLTVPIGRPVANTQMYVLDPHLEPLPIGVPGELFIGGVQVGRGYVGRADLTAERFIPDPFSRTPGSRLYKTGDLARHLPDGAIEYLGRLDYQVKIRGQRIELGEIEATLDKHVAVGQSVVMAREDTPGNQRLVAYVVARQATPSTAELKDHLLRELPAYMVPSAFVFLDSLPLTSSGKVDRKLLPAPERSGSQQTAYIAPGTATEKMLAGIWADVLEVERVGIEENFFDLGGHSLLLLQAYSRLRASLGREVPFVALMQYPTVRRLASYLSDTAEQAVVPAAVAVRAQKQREAMRRQRSAKATR
jgi:amino acid adenylation domain-containing protein